jgi:hypothetical protein
MAAKERHRPRLAPRGFPAGRYDSSGDQAGSDAKDGVGTR